MTAVSATPPALEQYLRRATAGLPPAKRQEVWDELEEHVYCRAEQLEWQGAAPEQALAQALAELGPPLRVSAGMNGVHNMPKILSIGGMAVLLVTAGLYALAQQPLPTAQVSVQTTAPELKCVKANEPQPSLPLLYKGSGFACYQNDAQERKGLYISFSEMKRAFAPLGMEPMIEDGGAKVGFFYKPLGKKVGEMEASFVRGGETYLDMRGLFVRAMGGNPFSVTVENAQNPVFTVAKLGQFSFSGQGQVSEQVYRTLAESAVADVLDFSKQGKYFGYDFVEARGKSRVVNTGLKAGEVVAAYQWVSSQPRTAPDGTNYLFNRVAITVGTVDEQGQVRLQLPAEAKFVTEQPAQAGNEVQLLKLTGTPFQSFKSGIFLPKP